MYLMHKDKPVLYMNWDNGKPQKVDILSEEFLPYRLRGAIFSQSDIDKEIISRSVSHDEEIDFRMSKWTDNWSAINSYFASRVITLSRSNMKKMFNYLGLSQSDSPLERAKISVKCKSTSMTDCYWIKSDESKKTWDEMNLRNVSLDKIIEVIALHGKITASGNVRTPDVPNPEISTFGTSGMAWKREGDDTFLYKKNGRYGHEAEIEISVSRILDCFNIPHANYEPASDDIEKRMCKSRNIARDGLEIVTAEDMMIYCNNTGKDFWKMMESPAFFEDFGKTIVTDYLISNPDRHEQNWGFYMNEDTGNIISCHPLFDHNHAFDEDMMSDPDTNCRMILSSVDPHISQKDMAHKWLSKSNIKCIKPVTRDLFLNDRQYESFMERASDLGLYYEVKPTFSQSLFGVFGKKYEEYYPEEITDSDAVLMTDYRKLRNTDSINTSEKTSQESCEVLNTVTVKSDPLPMSKSDINVFIDKGTEMESEDSIQADDGLQL